MSLANWYTTQYGSWNRTRRLQQTQYLARVETNTSRQARSMAHATTNGEAALHGLGNVGPPAKDNSKEKKGPDTLFGPNIGVINGGPAWTNATEKKMLKDELTMDVVKSWVDKSKESSQPTTTLQALVNLKRPTIRLSPLASVEGEDSHSQNHALEFEYDCDAPKCGIYVHVLLPPSHPDAPPSAPTPLASDGSPGKLSKLLVFEHVVDGGFGKVLKMEEGAVLELGRFEISRKGKPEDAGPSPSHSSSDTAVPNAANSGTAGTTPVTNNSRRKRLTHLFTKRHNNRNLSISGPALAIVDASSTANAASGDTDKAKKGEGEEGIKVTIRLAALDEQGTELASPNEQVTYLSVERFGIKAKPVSVPAANSESGGEEGKAEGTVAAAAEAKHEEEEDTRPWVVKVVKREATIGPHTFHLHEIYGLSSSTSSNHTHAPTAPLPSAHTYPPAAGAPVAEATENHDDSPSECLLCLSSPREVVLLPCRHLVACKDCALNMVEFGAGGNITQATEEPATTGDAAAEGNEGGASATPGVVPSPTLPTRRKRKAKGWFCPVCRQPYTSLLRITTNPPPPESKPETRPSAEHEESDDDHDEAADQDVAGASPSGLPLPVTAEPPTSAQPQNSVNATDSSAGSGGGLFSRPGFLRGLTGRNNASRGDLESQL
ncbi:hypothetical protein GYMLUDRAFT_49680 [Collybiopsis luxurians FD-317 M1]|uniref:RING-type domain-containing protein n=1 Tax=Collybiopsis luxurians FD-317 M1 TaxID=944289 RepID=A0A0D0BE09_9AGAR|nr:hypothetical protein GYMLUDRAFT_49680 [Collybiopsis luxurians FD-317 M1]